MTDPERYQREWEQIIRDREHQEIRAKYLRGVERLEQLFEAAERVGIDQAMAWKIVERNPAVPKQGLRALIREVCRRMTPDQRKEQIRYRIDQKARAIAEGQGIWSENIVQELRVAVPFQLSEDEARYVLEYSEWRRDHPISN
jgi:hypothetical protein